MKLVISEGQYKNLSESMDFGLEEMTIEEIQKYNLFISTINKQIKDQYPFVDEIKLSDERLYSFANRFNPSFIGFQREIRTVLYFEVYTTKNLNFIENLDFNKFEKFMEKTIKILLLSLFPKQFSYLISNDLLSLNFRFYDISK